VISTSTETNSFDNTIADSSTNEEVKKIDDIMSFKNSQTLYPLLKPFEKYFLRKKIFLEIK